MSWLSVWGRRVLGLRFSIVIPAVLVVGVAVPIVVAICTDPVSPTLSLIAGRFQLVSPPQCSSLSTAALLEAEIKNQLGSAATLEVARILPADPPVFQCYPAGSDIIADLCAANQSGCTGPTAIACSSSSDNLTWNPREGVLVRVNVSGSFTWVGSDAYPAAYSFLGGFDHWFAVPAHRPVTTADGLLNETLQGTAGTITRLLPTLPPTVDFWNGSSGSNFPVNPASGEGYQINPLTTVGTFGAPGTIEGTIYVDNNPENGVFDVGEAGAANVLVGLRRVSNNFTHYKTSDANGHYVFAEVWPGDYEARVPATVAGVTWTPTSYPITVAANQTSSDNDFGRMAAHDLEVGGYYLRPLTSQGIPMNPCPGVTSAVCVRYQNVGTFNEPDADIRLQLPTPAEVSFVSSYVSGTCTAPPQNPSPTADSGNLVTWNVSAPFPPGPGSDCTVCVNMIPTVPLGSTLTAVADVYLDYPDQDGNSGSANTLVASTSVNCAIDPNDMRVEPSGCGSAGFIPPGQRLTYLIRFQNLGSAPAFDVVVTDVLDEPLDPSSIDVVDTSHSLTRYEITEDRRLIFTFNGINLPDATSDEPGSHGFILFSIDQNAGLPEGTTISNTAAIVFDLNAPVVTNTVKNTITSNALPPGGEPGAEACNLVDDDCDGTVDNEPAVTASCQDGNPCTNNVCNLSLGTCDSSVLPDGTACDDANACTAPDTCAAGVCQLDSLLSEATPIVFDADTVTITWPSTSGPTHWNAYRGTIPASMLGSRLPSAVFDHACYESADDLGDGATLSTDASVPAGGTAYYYEITEERSCGEGPLGAQSAGPVRPNTAPCPTPP